jgi:hypothetical protein
MGQQLAELMELVEECWLHRAKYDEIVQFKAPRPRF